MIKVCLKSIQDVNELESFLQQPCVNITGVGKVLAEKLAKCGIYTIQDLLFHLPFRYQDKTRITPIQDLQANDWSVVVGKISRTKAFPGRRSSFYCYIEDGTGVLPIRFFHFNKQLVNSLLVGKKVKVFGEVREFNNSLQMTHPEYSLIDDSAPCVVEETLTPIYSSTQGLSQGRLRQIIKNILEEYKDELQYLEWMDASLLLEHNFQPITKALFDLHNPPPDILLLDLENGSHQGLRRLAFEELLAHNLSMKFARQKRSYLKAPKMLVDDALTEKFLSNLSFTLTDAQVRVYREIQKDICKGTPMLRLVQGDVGSGKTVISALVSLQVIANGYQVALMAPTDILSEQHTYTIKNWLEPLGIKVLRLSGKMKAREKKAVLTALKEHDCQIITGTHALFQENVEFAKLGLVIIDEQHRFGVEQRSELQQKGQNLNLYPHQLLMTATPIPRTLAMTGFSHLDLSAIDEMPVGRTKVLTAVLPQSREDVIIERLKIAMRDGRQAYWVCTLIEESEKLQCINAIKRAEDLQKELPSMRIGLVHGRLKAQEKEAIMHDFKHGKIDLLVATTVIEVGVDVPNASLMIIENAERLGLSQLHQLRGRVGRGNIQSCCLLLYKPPLSLQGRERLQIMRLTNDGFVIAEKDLQIRGFGEVLGRQQTGYRKFKIADIKRDNELLSIVSKEADSLIKQHGEIAKSITRRWLGEVEHFVLT